MATGVPNEHRPDEGARGEDARDEPVRDEPIRDEPVQVGPARFNPMVITLPEWLVIGSAALYLVTLVLPWLSVSVPVAGLVGFDQSASGFSFAILVLALLMLVMAAAWVLLPLFGVRRPVLAITAPLVPLGLCALALLLTLGKLADVLTASSEYEGFGVDVSAGVGAYLGVLTAAAAVTGAAMLYLADQADAPRRTP